MIPLYAVNSNKLIRQHFKAVDANMFSYIVCLVWFNWEGGIDCHFIKVVVLLHYQLTKASVFL